MLVEIKCIKRGLYFEKLNYKGATEVHYYPPGCKKIIKTPDEFKTHFGENIDMSKMNFYEGDLYNILL